MRQIIAATGEKTPYAEATWRIVADARTESYDLAICWDGRTFHRPLKVGQPTYAEPMIFYDDASITGAEVRMQPVKLFGVVPGVWILAPWLVAYLLIAIPAVPLLKRLLRIY